MRCTSVTSSGWKTETSYSSFGPQPQARKAFLLMALLVRWTQWATDLSFPSPLVAEHLRIHAMIEPSLRRGFAKAMTFLCCSQSPSLRMWNVTGICSMTSTRGLTRGQSSVMMNPVFTKTHGTWTLNCSCNSQCWENGIESISSNPMQHREMIKFWFQVLFSSHTAGTQKLMKLGWAFCDEDWVMTLFTGHFTYGPYKERSQLLANGMR